MPSETLTYTGAEQTWTVPSGVDRVLLKSWGADGGDDDTGLGGGRGYAEGYLSVSPGETLRVYVGQNGGDRSGYGDGRNGAGGWNGGGHGGENTSSNTYSAGGGGASDVRQGGATLNDRVIVGAGGGGATIQYYEDGGGGGGLEGGRGGPDHVPAEYRGDGGTQTAGGAGGTTEGEDGTFGQGGAGGYDNGDVPGGGGGGGWYGGGGGANYDSNDAGGGGGGSSYIAPLTSASTTAGALGGSQARNGEIQILYAGDPTLDSVTSSTDREVDLAWTNGDTYDSVRIYRAQSTGSAEGDYTLIDTVAGSATSYTDTGLNDGERYFYRVQGVAGDFETNLSNEGDATTNLPGPGAPTASNVDANSADLSWTANHNNGQTRVEFRATGAASWSVDSTVAYTTTTAALAGLLNGEEYEARVVAVTEHDETPSSAGTPFTTVLPDEDQPVPQNGVEDEVTLDRETTVSNYGDVRIQQRETGESVWDSTAVGWDEMVVSFDTLTPTFTGLEDGEEYEWRARTETEHVQGNWTTPVAIVTAFPAITGLQATVGETSLTIEGTDNADNEDGVTVERRENFRDGYGPWVELTDLGPNTGTGTISFTDNQVLPETTYEYRFTAYTEDASAVSTIEVTTADDGVRSDQVPARGWHVAVLDSDGIPHTPNVGDDAVFRPALNDLPTCEIPVPKAPKWADKTAWERQPLRVYEDGERRPIEEVTNIVEEEDRFIIKGTGGVELRERIERDVIERDAHLEAQDVITTGTSYTAHVDDPASSTQADVLQQSVATTGEWTDALATPPGPSDVYEVAAGGELQPRQTTYFVEAENADTLLISDPGPTGSDWSGDASVAFDRAEQNGTWARLEHTFTTDHDIPSGEASIAIRYRSPTGEHPGFNVLLNGTELTSIPAEFAIAESEPTWLESPIEPLPTTLPAGDATVTIEFDEYSGGTDPLIEFDCVVLYDGRYDPDVQLTTTSSTLLRGLDQYPQLQIETADVITVEQVVGGRLAATVDKTGDPQAVALSNDSGATWPLSASNTGSVVGSFSSGSTSLRVRFTLGGYDPEPTTSPVGWKAPQTVSGYDLFADLEDTPLLLNRSWTESAKGVLDSIASYGNFIWWIVWDDSIPGIAIEWTLPGQRTGSEGPGLVNYSVDTDYSSIHRRAEIFGQGIPESTDFDAVHDTWVSLEEGSTNIQYLQEVGERVYNPVDETEFVRNADYELRPNTGEIRALSTGNMADGGGYAIEYSRRLRGVYESADYDGSYETFVDTVSSVTTERNAAQLALAIVRKTSEPLVTAEVTIDREPEGLSLVEAIDFDHLPADNLEVWNVENTPREIRLQLGSREPISELIARLQRRLAAAERKLG